MLNKILIIGESCKDVFIYGKVERLEPAAPVPVVKAVKTVTNGGMAMNVAMNLKSLGIVYDIHTNSTWESITKTRIVEQTTNHMFLRMDSNENEYQSCLPKEIDFSKYIAVIICDYNKGFLTKKDIQYICKSHSLVFLDTKKKLEQWCECATYIKINQVEYNNAKKITKKIRENLIITLGSKGAKYLDKVYSVQQTEVKDLSGAGDTFLAGLVSNYIKTKDMDRAIEFANECATKVVQKQGVSTIGN